MCICERQILVDDICQPICQSASTHNDCISHGSLSQYKQCRNIVNFHISRSSHTCMIIKQLINLAISWSTGNQSVSFLINHSSCKSFFLQYHLIFPSSCFSNVITCCFVSCEFKLNILGVWTGSRMKTAHRKSDGNLSLSFSFFFHKVRD